MFYKVFLNHLMNLGFQVLPHCINGQPMFMTTFVLILAAPPSWFFTHSHSYFLLYIHYSKCPIQKSRQKKARNQFDCGPAFLSPGRPGMGFPAGSPYSVGVGGSRWIGETRFRPYRRDDRAARLRRPCSSPTASVGSPPPSVGCAPRVVKRSRLVRPFRRFSDDHRAPARPCISDRDGVGASPRPALPRPASGPCSSLFPLHSALIVTVQS